MVRVLYLHVGTGKSGTSALQKAVRDSAAALSAAGIGTPITGRSEKMQRLLGPLGWRPQSGFSQRVDLERIRRIRSAFRRAPGDPLFLSCEDLADAGPEPIRVLRELLEEVELEIRPVVSGRSWARQLPSDYQQLVQAGLALGYRDFLEQVRTRSGEAGERFWRRQSVPEIAANWGAASPDGVVDVVCVPSHAEDPRALYRLFAEIVGFSVSDLTIPGGTINASFGVVEVELFRRVNALLKDRLPSYADDYRPAVRRPMLRQGVLKRSASARLELPSEALGWVREQGEHDIAALRAGGHRLHGDPSLLVATDADVGTVPVAGDAELADAAIEALAELAIVAHGERKALAAEVARLKTAAE
jgi:hypothetical protein